MATVARCDYIGEQPFHWGRQGGCGSGGYATYGDLDPREHRPGVYDHFDGSAAVVTSTLKDLRGIRSIHALNSSHCLLPPAEPHLVRAAGVQWSVPPPGDSSAWAGAEAWQRAQAAAATLVAAGPPSQQQGFMQAPNSTQFDNCHPTASLAATYDRSGSNQVLSQFYTGAERSQSTAACAGGSSPQASGRQQQVKGLPADARPGCDANFPPPKIDTANQFKDSSSYILASPENVTVQLSEEDAPTRRSRGKSGPKTLPSCTPWLAPCRLGC